MRRSRGLCALAVALCLLLQPQTPAGDALDELIGGVEDVVNLVAQRAADLFTERFPSVADCQCSRHACDGQFDLPAGECRTELGDSELCGGCSGQKLDFENSLVLTPPSTDNGDIDPSMKDSICTFRGMDGAFAEARDQFGIRAWTYIATTNGVMRTWPGHAMVREMGTCMPYDPRPRPWYVAATSGPKDVVLVIDTSGSMLTADGEVFGDFRSRWQITRETIIALLGTFGITDYVNIVTFNSVADVLLENELFQAREDKVALLRNEVENISPLGGTDFRLGMDKAFELLITATKNSLEDEQPTSSDCQKVILFLTDGEDCTISNTKCSMPVAPNVTGVDSVLEFIEQKQVLLEATGSQRAHLFTFSFGFDADDEIPKEMACSNEGAWGRILPGDDPLAKMNAYTSYLALERGEADVIWSRTYDDAFGLGSVITAAKPVYSPMTSLGEPGGLIGVVGHDVRITDFNETAPGFERVIGRFISRGTQCIPIDFSGCDLQLLRGPDAQCPEIFDDAPCYFFEETGDYYIAPKQPLLDFAGADAYCQDLGGFLAEIDERLEEELLSGIASNSGSWVGLTFNDNTSEWAWTNSGRTEDERSVIWTVLSFPTGGFNKECATIDRRGVLRNIRPEDCRAERRFICEFLGSNPPEVCTGGDVITVDELYQYNVRPLSTCRPEEESLRDATAISPAAESLANENVVCPIRKETSTTAEVRCCDDCKL